MKDNKNLPLVALLLSGLQMQQLLKCSVFGQTSPEISENLRHTRALVQHQSSWTTSPFNLNKAQFWFRSISLELAAVIVVKVERQTFQAIFINIDIGIIVAIITTIILGYYSVIS